MKGTIQIARAKTGDSYDLAFLGEPLIFIQVHACTASTPPDEARLSPGDDVLVELNDGVLACGQWLTVNTNTAVLQMSLYRTLSGTDVTPRLWRLVPTNEHSVMRCRSAYPTHELKCDR
jgi:hypothetical protein